MNTRNKGGNSASIYLKKPIPIFALKIPVGVLLKNHYLYLCRKFKGNESENNIHPRRDYLHKNRVIIWNLGQTILYLPKEVDDMLSNSAIVGIYMRSGLIARCVAYQCRIAHVTADRKDIQQDLCERLLKLDNKRLNEVHEVHRMNAFLTKILRTELAGSHSAYHRNYRRYQFGTHVIRLEDER